MREIDFPVDRQACPSPAPHPPIGHRKQQSQHPAAWQARVRTPPKRQDLPHQLITTLGVPEWHELGNTLAMFLPSARPLLLLTSAGAQFPGESEARGLGRRTRRAYICPSISRVEVGKGRLNFVVSSAEVGWVLHPPYKSNHQFLPKHRYPEEPSSRANEVVDQVRYRLTEPADRRGRGGVRFCNVSSEACNLAAHAAALTRFLRSGL